MFINKTQLSDARSDKIRPSAHFLAKIYIIYRVRLFQRLNKKVLQEIDMWHLISLANVVNFLFNIKRVTINAKLYKKKKTTDICLVIKVVTEQTNINDTCLLF